MMTGKKLITLDDYVERILEPSIQALERREGLTRRELLTKYERDLAPSRRIMKQVRQEAIAKYERGLAPSRGILAWFRKQALRTQND